MSESNIEALISDISLETVITNVIESLALEETALSVILVSEGEILLETAKISDNINEFIAINESVNNIVKNVFKLQIMLQFQLDNAEHMLERADEYFNGDELEE